MTSSLFVDRNRRAEPERPRPGGRRKLPGARPLSDGGYLYWWREALIVVVVDLVYETIRNLSDGTTETAYRNALRIIDWQEALRINHEEAIQDWALRWEPLIIAANYFYGSAYILVTLFVLVFLYRRHADSYPRWRNALVATTLLGLVGFKFFPLMPPRLLDVEGDGTVFGFVDTLAEFPTFWSFQSEAMSAISNQYAAMPSLHCAWAFWGTCALWNHVRSRTARVAAVAYSVTTVVVVVITANHYFLDAVGGAGVFVAGYGLARALTRAGRRQPPPAMAVASS